MKNLTYVVAVAYLIISLNALLKESKIIVHCINTLPLQYIDAKLFEPLNNITLRIYNRDALSLYDVEQIA